MFQNPAGQKGKFDMDKNIEINKKEHEMDEAMNNDETNELLDKQAYMVIEKQRIPNVYFERKDTEPLVIQNVACEDKDELLGIMPTFEIVCSIQDKIEEKKMRK